MFSSCSSQTVTSEKMSIRHMSVPKFPGRKSLTTRDVVVRNIEGIVRRRYLIRTSKTFVPCSKVLYFKRSLRFSHFDPSDRPPGEEGRGPVRSLPSLGVYTNKTTFVVWVVLYHRRETNAPSPPTSNVLR